MCWHTSSIGSATPDDRSGSGEGFRDRQRDCHDAPDHGAGGAVVVGSATPGGRSCDAETEAEGQDADGGDCGVAVDGGQRHHAEGLEAEDGRYDVSQLESLRSGE
jgi:hypothetical protein